MSDPICYRKIDRKKSKMIKLSNWPIVALWCSGHHYCTASFNKAWTQVQILLVRIRDLRWWESLAMVPAWNKATHVLSVNPSAKTIHHYHHHHHHHHPPRVMCHTVIIFTWNYFCILSFQIGRAEFLSTGMAHRIGIGCVSRCVKVLKQLYQLKKGDYLTKVLLKTFINLAGLYSTVSV